MAKVTRNDLTGCYNISEWHDCMRDEEDCIKSIPGVTDCTYIKQGSHASAAGWDYDVGFYVVVANGKLFCLNVVHGYRVPDKCIKMPFDDFCRVVFCFVKDE